MPNDAFTESATNVVADGRFSIQRDAHEDEFLVDFAAHTSAALLNTVDAVADRMPGAEDGAGDGLAHNAASASGGVAGAPLDEIVNDDVREALGDTHAALSGGVGDAIEAMADHGHADADDSAGDGDN